MFQTTNQVIFHGDQIFFLNHHETIHEKKKNGDLFSLGVPIKVSWTEWFVMVCSNSKRMMVFHCLSFRCNPWLSKWDSQLNSSCLGRFVARNLRSTCSVGCSVRIPSDIVIVIWLSFSNYIYDRLRNCSTVTPN